MKKKSIHIILVLLVALTNVLLAQKTGSISPSFVSISSSPINVKPVRNQKPLTVDEINERFAKRKKKKLNMSLETKQSTNSSNKLEKDPVWQKQAPSSRGTNAPMQNFGGITSNMVPSDCNGSVSAGYYVQAVNSLYSVYSKTGTLLVGPLAINSLFSGLPGSGYNDGDPIVLFDDQADRWVITEMSVNGTNDYLLVAISQTNDPTGSWYAYSFDVDDMPDYPKFGIWRDGYYIGTNKKSTVITDQEDIFVIERDKMLLGQTAQIVGFINPDRPSNDFQLASPVDNDGSFASSDKPGLFVTINDNNWNSIKDQIWIYELEVDWTNPTNSTFQRSQALDVASFIPASNPGIEQIYTNQTLDGIGDVVMHRPVYRNYGNYETMVLCHNVSVGTTYNGGDHVGVRWYELTRIDGSWEIRQQGTYAPDDKSRWMGSVTINENHRIAVGYSVSNASMFPGIRYAAQSPTAYATANGQLDIAEEVLYNGLSSQDNDNRWGDYSNISVDPSNDSVFWYTNQYIGSGGGINGRKTRIASFKFGSFSLTADFVANNTTPVVNVTSVDFYDKSYGAPDSWQWSFSPNNVTYTGSTSSTSQNPKVIFTAAGTYSVTLTVGKSGSNDSEIKTGYIEVSPSCIITTFPWTENFENSGNIPNCWNEEYVTIDNRDWSFVTGDNGLGYITSAHSGTYNADLLENSGTTKLITPQLDLSSLSTAQVNFWQAREASVSGIDLLKIYYKNSPTGNWQLLAEYSSAMNSWHNDSVSLPNLSSTYYVAFEGIIASGVGILIDDVTVKSAVVSCPSPAGQSAIAGSTNAQLNWFEGASATQWQIEWGLDGFTMGTGTMVSTVNTTYDLTGLTNLTNYDWYVRSICGSGDTSLWVGPSGFTTLEQSFQLPVTEDFESGLVKFNNKAGNDVNWGQNFLIYHGGAYSASNTYGKVNTNILYETGIMDLSSVTLPALTFWHIAKTEGGNDFCKVEISTDGGQTYSLLSKSSYHGFSATYSDHKRFDETSYSLWQSGTPDNTWWKKETFYLTDYKTTKVKIRFRLTSDNNTNYGTWYIDDITIDNLTCPPPENQTVTDIQYNSAKLSWTEFGSSTTWDIEYGLTGFTQGTGTTITSTTLNPLTISSLTASTTYDWYVRSSCGSSWTGSHSFQTPCAPVSIPYFEDFETVTLPNIPSCMTREDVNADTKEWETSNWYYSSGSNSARIAGNVSIASNDWLFTKGLQLTGGVTYECGFGYKSGSGYIEKLEVKIGSSASASEMTKGTIWQNTSFTNWDFKLGNGTFTPTITGTYYIGFHGFSNANADAVYIDDIYVIVKSDTAVWTGTTSSDWWNASNWGNDTLPGGETNILIPGGLTNYPLLDHISGCNNITIGSSSAGDGSIIDKKLLNITGQATVQRYLTGGKWHQIAAPVSNATVNSLYFNHNPDVWLKEYNEPTDTWTGITSLTTPMPFGKGFIVWVENGNNVTANFTGSLKSDELFLDSFGSIPALSYSGSDHGFNLIGNPYASALDWDIGIWDTTGIDGNIWVWNSTNGNYAYRNSLGQGSLTNGIIPMGQGFFIRTNNVNISFGVYPDARVNSTQSYYKASNISTNPYIVITANKDEKIDEVWVSFADNATDEYDNGMDVIKMFSDINTPQLYLVSNPDSLSIVALPIMYNTTRIINLNYGVGESGFQKFILSETFMMENTEIILEDLFLNKLIDFKQHNEYTFDASVTDDANRFKLHFINTITSNEEIDNNEGVFAFDDDGSIYVAISDNYRHKIADIRIFDLLGRKTADVKTGNKIYHFDKLPGNQYYIVKIMINNSIIVKKVYLR